MKLVSTMVVVCGLDSASAAFAQTPKEVIPSKMKCSEFVATDETYRPALNYWVAGVGKLGVRENDRLLPDVKAA
jgi:acid stress chaperone HdeA